MILLFLIILLAVWMTRNPLNNDGALMQLYDNYALPERPPNTKKAHWYEHTFNRPRK